MARDPRDYKAEYRRRLARGLARGLTPSQARGHPRKGELPASKVGRVEKPDKATEVAILLMNKGATLRAAARQARVSARTLRQALTDWNLASKVGGRWRMHDTRPRNARVPTRGQLRVITLAGYAEASKAARADNLIRQFVRTGDIRHLAPLEAMTVRAANGERHPIETDPNTLFRLWSAGEPAFHEVYSIIS